MAKIEFSKVRKKYAQMWASMSIREDRSSAIDGVVKRILANKTRYEEVADKARVPWFLIAILHYRESNLSFSKHLHNGDSLKNRTYRVPAGRPLVGEPPYTWEESALDALAMKGLHNITDWSIERIIYEAIRYNGFGYEYRGLPSPYAWSGSNHYTAGKFIRDHVFDERHVDKQLGVLPILKRLAEVDTTIDLASAKVAEKKFTEDIVSNSTKLTMGRRVRKFGAWLGIGSYLSWEFLASVRSFATDNAGFMFLGIALLAWFASKWFEWKSVQDAKEGRYVPSGKKKKAVA
jgi:lysozyme family protein